MVGFIYEILGKREGECSILKCKRKEELTVVQFKNGRIGEYCTFCLPIRADVYTSNIKGEDNVEQ